MLVDGPGFGAGITGGLLRERRGVAVGVVEDPKLTAAFFDMFLGTSPLDPHAKERVGLGLLYVANGFRHSTFDCLLTNSHSCQSSSSVRCGSPFPNLFLLAGQVYERS